MIYEWAKEILLTRELKNKLLTAPRFAQTRPVKDLDFDCREPGRPDPLRFTNKRAAFPSLHELEHEEGRGKALHFFANHELLAIELMAYALLKFNHTPRAFQISLLQTIQEEQEHLAFYISAMEKSGISFGDLPVSDFFWKSMAPLKSPLHFVSQMSMCFEQANLDYALYYQKAFEKVGDIETASVLKKVYEDEIKHVKLGYHWFQQWKDPAKDDFEVWQEHLEMPLNPRRAKGIDFSWEARKAAGLREDYINKVYVYEGSKGAVPRLFVFNPNAEEESSYLTNKGKSSFTPKLDDKIIAHDLAHLPMTYAKASDLVLAPNELSIEQKKLLRDFGFNLCEVVDEMPFSKNSSRIIAKKIETWGPSPKFSNVNAETLWVYDKRNHQILLKYLLETLNHKAFVSSKELSDGKYPYVIKPAFGSSGKDRRIIKNKNDEQKYSFNRPYIKESWLEKVEDYSLHFDLIDQNHIKFLGMTTFITDEKGRYRGTWIERKVDTFVPFEKENSGFFNSYIEAIKLSLQYFMPQYFSEYSGPLGIDGFTYCKDGKIKIHPACDFNFRYSMGRVALILSKKIDPKSYAFFKIEQGDAWQAHEFKYRKTGFIEEGVFPLTNYQAAKKYTAVLYVHPDKQKIRDVAVSHF